MGEVAVTLRLMPSGSDADLASIEAKVRESTKVHSVEREPIAFGLEALRIVAVIGDAAGGTDELEAKLAGIQGVGNVQVIGLTRLL